MAKRRVVQGRAGTGELNYLSQFDIKGSDQILRRALTENCHTHSDSDRGQDTKYIQSIAYLLGSKYEEIYQVCLINQTCSRYGQSAMWWCWWWHIDFFDSPGLISGSQFGYDFGDFG